MQAVDTEVDGSALTGLNDLVVELLLDLGNHLLDTCRMDTTIADELMESQAAYFTTYRIETADNDGLRSIVYYDFNTCSSLKGTDITTLATDDAALHLVVINMEHADRVLNGRLCGYTLDGLNDDLTGLLVGIELCFVHNLIDIAGCSCLGLVFQRLDKTGLGIGSTKPRHLFQHLAFLELHLLKFLGLDREQALLIVNALLLVVELVLLATQLFLTLIKGDFTLLQLVLTLLHLLVALLHFFLHLIVFPLQNEAENQISANSTQYECAGSDQ